jgi:hypothetical protein
MNNVDVSVSVFPSKIVQGLRWLTAASPGRILGDIRPHLEPLSRERRPFIGAGLLSNEAFGGLDMPRAIHLFAPIPAASSTKKSDDRPLDPRILFGGICLVAFLIAILTGTPGAWY